MTIHELVTELRDRDVKIFDEGHALKLNAPRGIITPQLLELITCYSAELLYLVRIGDVRVCPSRWEHRPRWRYSPSAQQFVCCACRQETTA